MVIITKAFYYVAVYLTKAKQKDSFFYVLGK